MNNGGQILIAALMLLRVETLGQASRQDVVESLRLTIGTGMIFRGLRDVRTEAAFDEFVELVA